MVVRSALCRRLTRFSLLHLPSTRKMFIFQTFKIKYWFYFTMQPPIRRKIFQFHLRLGARRKPQNNNRRNSSSLCFIPSLVFSSALSPWKIPADSFCSRIYDCFHLEGGCTTRKKNIKDALRATRKIDNIAKVYFDVLQAGPRSSPLNFISIWYEIEKEFFVYKFSRTSSLSSEKKAPNVHAD